MYKVRCSSIGTLLAGCGKVTNKLEWKDLTKMNDSHIGLAIEIYNKKHGFESESITTLDMNAGNEHESDAIKMYDEYFGTKYHKLYLEGRQKMKESGKRSEMSNEYLTGTRDFGDNKKTIDCKVSTDKNVFDRKRFEALDLGYICQVNGYGYLYGTKELELYNALMPATFGQIKKMVSSKAYIEMLDDFQQDELQARLEANYGYDFLPLAKRVQAVPIPKIDNFQEIIKVRVETLNEWIDKNKNYL